MKRIFALLALLVALSPFTRAQTLIVTPNTANEASASGQAFSGSTGLFFAVNPGFSVTVTSVGFWDFGATLGAGSDGVQGTDTISVAIFNNGGGNGIVTNSRMDFDSVTGASSTGTLMGGTFTPATNPTVGEFRAYTLGTPVTLLPGNYAIVGWSYTTAGVNDFINGGTSGSNTIANFDTLGGALSFSGSYFNTSPGVLPDTQNGSISNPSYLSATFIGAATAIPEPATYAEILGMIAFAVVTFRVLKRRRDLTI